MVYVIISFFVGCFAGGAIVLKLKKSKAVGTLRVDTSDPKDGPYLFLELSEDVSQICKEDQITLRVNNSNYIAQE